MSTNFVGIDLGTTNSAIVSYNGIETRIWKSPEQNDVTPSAIYIDRRRKYVGRKAYDAAAGSPDNVAMLFKRLMGTNTPIHFVATNEYKTPEECSAEILKTLFGYLPEEIRNDPNTSTVITVPAAFNQMQKDATMKAAEIAQLGRVALMQEPVAAVMSVMTKSDKDGSFLIYDLGGGTLDIAIAESLGGRVNLLSQGGLQMCGGRDFDRAIFDKVIKTYLLDNFDLPENFEKDPQFKRLVRVTTYAGEKAKIELSAGRNALIDASENEISCLDLSGHEIYIEQELTREIYEPLIEQKIDESIQAAHEALNKAGLHSSDLSKIVFVGGPTNYAPLREKVSRELGVPTNVDVNPMTAVAEGAAIFAESIDWSNQSRGRKSSRGSISSGGNLPVSFNFTARTPERKAKVVVKLSGSVSQGCEFEISSMDTGWESGRIPLEQDEFVSLPLDRTGDNHFEIHIFDASGGSISFPQNKITITRTAATIDAIPASHSIGVEVQESLGSKHTVLDYLIKAGDSLPKHGKKNFKAAETLKSGSLNSLKIKLWEGEIEYSVDDNRPIGCLKISGSDFDDGVIPAGADLEVEYEITDSGNIKLSVTVPAIGAVFGADKGNFYSRQEGQLNFEEAQAEVKSEARRTIDRIAVMENKIDDPRLDQARDKLREAMEIEKSDDTESVQQALEKVYEARKLTAQVRKDKIHEVQQAELDEIVKKFNQSLRTDTSKNDANSFDNLVRTIQNAINEKDVNSAEALLEELKEKFDAIKANSPQQHIEFFNMLCDAPEIFDDQYLFRNHKTQGERFIQENDFDGLVNVIRAMIRNSSELQRIFAHRQSIDANDTAAMMIATSNILRG